MHEQSIVEPLLALALKKAEEAEAKRIVRIYLVVGVLAGVVESSVDFYFAFLGRNTIAEGAEIMYQRVPAELRCRNCGTVFQFKDNKLDCPECSQRKVEIISGREIFLDSMEVE